MPSFRLLALVLGAALGACAMPPQTGIMSGRVIAKGLPPTEVVMSWEEGSGSNGGSISTTLAGGERFTGQFVRVTAGAGPEAFGPYYSAWGPVWGPAWGVGADPWGGDVTMVEWVQLYSGKVVATLFGDRGDSMRCRFQLTDPEAGLSGGGVGQCQVSNGWEINVQL